MGDQLNLLLFFSILSHLKSATAWGILGITHLKQIIMKTVSQLFKLIGEVVNVNAKNYENDYPRSEWFIDYHGHVNKVHVKYYRGGWKSGDGTFESIEESLTSEGLQTLYWFIKNRK